MNICQCDDISEVSKISWLQVPKFRKCHKFKFFVNNQICPVRKRKKKEKPSYMDERNADEITEQTSSRIKQKRDKDDFISFLFNQQINVIFRLNVSSVNEKVSSENFSQDESFVLVGDLEFVIDEDDSLFDFQHTSSTTEDNIFVECSSSEIKALDERRELETFESIAAQTESEETVGIVGECCNDDDDELSQAEGNENELDFDEFIEDHCDGMQRRFICSFVYLFVKSFSSFLDQTIVKKKTLTV